MGTRRQLQAGAFFALACVLSLAATPARAGNPIIARYAPGDQVLTVYFDPSAPTGKFRKRIADAAATWRKLPGVERFEVHKSPSMAISADPCADQDGVPVGGVLRGPVAGSGTLAENRSCIDSETGRLIGFRQTYNKRMKFYMGSGEPPANKFDLQAVATHELGHSEGWTGDHFSNRNNSKLCANRSKQATMCPANYSGTKRLRTLTKDDKQPAKEFFKPTEVRSTGTITAGGQVIAYDAIAGTLVIHSKDWSDTDPLEADADKSTDNDTDNDAGKEPI